MPRFSYIHNVNFLSALPMILNETRQDCYLKGVWRINRLVFPKSGPSKIGPCTKYYLCKNTYLPPHSDNKSWQRESSTQINTLRNLPCCCGNPQLEKKNVYLLLPVGITICSQKQCSLTECFMNWNAAYVFFMMFSFLVHY